MKEEKDIQAVDKLFRQSLEGYSSPPPASVWKKVRARVSEPKSTTGKWFKSPGGYSVVSAVVLLIASWMIYKSFVAEPETAKQSPQIISLSVDSVIPQLPASEKSNASTYSTANAAGKKASENNSKPGNLPSVSKNSQVSTKASSLNKSLNQPSTIPQNSLNARTKTIKNSTPDVDSKIAVPVKKDIQVLNSKSNESIKVADKNVLSPEQDFIDSFVERSVSPKVTLTPDTFLVKDSVPDKSQTSGPGANLPGNNTVTSETTENLMPMANNMVWQAGIYGNISKVYQKDRNANLFYGGMITGGFWNKKWKAGIETGIGYCYYKDQGRYEFEFQRKDTVGYTGYTYFNTFDSSYLIIYKPTVTDTLLYHDTITKTSYSYLRIPLYFSKQLFKSGKFSVGLKTGPSVEFMITRNETQPQYLLPGATLISVKNKSYSRLSTSWQWLIAPQLSWDITDKIVFHVEPAAVFYLNNLYDKNNRPATKPYGISITGGLIYKFD